MRQDVKSVYYLLTFLFEFAAGLTFATYVLFLLSRGLDLFQVTLVNLSFMIGIFIFEIPTGAYADHFGRKKSVILSSIFLILALLIYFESTNIAMFIIAEIVAALAFTFASGALDAWMVDSLESKNYTGKVDFIFSHAAIIGKTAALLAGLIGAYIGSVNLALPFGVGAVVAFLALLVSIFYIKENIQPQKSLDLSGALFQMTQVTKNSIAYGVKHKVVLWLIISSILTTFAFQPLNMFWSPRMNELAGNKIWLMGWVWAAISLSMMLGSLLIKQLLKREKSYTWILILTSLILAIPILLVSTSSVFGVVVMGFLMYELGRGMLTPTHKAYLNRHIPGEQRATVLSFDSMMARVGAALGLVILGWTAKNYSIQVSWLISGLLLFLLIPIYLKARKNESAMQ
jgi:MFS family permease